jgi:hypothetical protein
VEKIANKRSINIIVIFQAAAWASYGRGLPVGKLTCFEEIYSMKSVDEDHALIIFIP